MFEYLLKVITGSYYISLFNFQGPVRSFFPFLSAFLPLSVLLFSCRPERNSCYYIALHPFCQHFFWIFFDFFSFLFFALYIVVYQYYGHKIFPTLTAFRRLPSKKSFLSSKKILNFFKKYFLFFEKILFLFHYRMFFNPLKSHLTSFTIFNYTLNIHIWNQKNSIYSGNLCIIYFVYNTFNYTWKEKSKKKIISLHYNLLFIKA